MRDTLAVNARLLDSLRQEDFAGHDPFDLLNSRLLKGTPLYRSEWARLAWLQLGKRSPINPRSLLRVPRLRNPKGIGLIVAGMLQDHQRTRGAEILREAADLGRWLIDHRSCGDLWGAHSSWGYHFDWQARAFYVPAGKPNVVTTVYVARALHELGEAIGDRRMTEVALDAARFISNMLYTEFQGRTFYAYIPGEGAFVHNASLWGSAWCAFAGERLGDEAMTAQALRVARQSVAEQRADGSWVYGAREHHRFVDGFHTGYNLEALCMVRDALGVAEFDECIAKGFDYYKEAFFMPDGTAKYYNDDIYPLDMHSFAQAILTLLKIGGSKELALCHKVVASAMDQMYLPRTGRFLYQRGKWLTNRINYSRWTQAWAYNSLSYYNRFCAESIHASN